MAAQLAIWGVTNETIFSGTGDAGGIAADAENESFINVYTTGNITGNEFTGGLVGDGGNASISISNSYSTAAVTDNQNVGGLVGTLNGSISNSYYSGTINGGNISGGLVGTPGGDVTITNSYSNANYGSVDPDNGGAIIGGQNGPVNITLTNVYWNSDNISNPAVSNNDITAGDSVSSSSVQGESTTTLQGNESAYSGFTFGSAVGVWTISSGNMATLVLPQVLSGVIGGRYE